MVQISATNIAIFADTGKNWGVFGRKHIVFCRYRQVLAGAGKGIVFLLGSCYICLFITTKE